MTLAISMLKNIFLSNPKCKTIIPSNVQDWSPHMRFILKSSRTSALQLKGWFNPIRQSKNIEMKYKTHIKLVHELHDTWVWREELRINHLTLLFVVIMSYAWWFLWRAKYIEDFKWCLHFQFGVAFWRVVLREVYFEGLNRIWRALKTSILNIDPKYPNVQNKTYYRPFTTHLRWD